MPTNYYAIGITLRAHSIYSWTIALDASAMTVKPRLYIGAPAFAVAGTTAYANIGNAQFTEVVAQEVKSLDMLSLGGIMFWDEPEGMLNK